MEKITSFTIDHIRLVPGVYVSRKDPIGNEIITTFDLRMTSPNDEPVMNRCMRLNISPPHFYGIILYLEIRSSTLDQWDVAPDFICYWRVTTAQKISSSF